MTECDLYNPDKVFKKFKVLEFPTSFVELSTKQILDVETDLNTSAYLKTLCEGRLLKFNEAREISPSHRAFDIKQVDNHRIQITYHPKNECISRAKRNKQLVNRFVFDLRLIQVNDIRCCNYEPHAEIGRFYISGQYEFCKITHHPDPLDFGNVFVNERVTTHIRMRNESNGIAAKVRFERCASIDVTPERFTILPNSSIKLAVSIKPTTLKTSTTILFKIRNPYDEIQDESEETINNYITYIIRGKICISLNTKPKIIVIESLHKLYDQLPKYTYLDKELKIHNERKTIAIKQLDAGKQTKFAHKKTMKEKFATGRDKCYIDQLPVMKPDGNFCKVVEPKASAYELFDIIFLPFLIDFGKVGLSTYGREKLTIKNGTKYKVTIRLCPDDKILYTEHKVSTTIIRLEPLQTSKVTMYCMGFTEGKFFGSFEYYVDHTYRLKHMYTLQVGHPILMVTEKSLKFGMVTTDSFVTSVPIRLYNQFNETAYFEWSEINSEIPFEIIPMTGSIPGQSCKICDVMYICKPTKTKSHEVDFVSRNCNTKIELSIVTRKLSIKFLQPTVIFKEIPLNMEITEKVKLENSSREIALFYVVEPLIPGLRIEPMSGTIRPKMIITFDIIVKIPCIVEFAFDVLVKINNKENVVLPISGTVVEPKIVIQPKNIYMPRIPCHMVTYVPVTFQNLSPVRNEVQVLETGDDNMFDVYVAQGNEKQRVLEFIVEGGQSKTVFIKVCDVFRREYDMYIPFKINGLLGPPEQNEIKSTELQYYIGEYEQYYESNPKIKLKSINKDISYCRIIGVITVPWVTFSVDKFEFDYIPHQSNIIEFTATNISKYYLYVTIMTAKLVPNFSLDIHTPDCQSIISDSQIKFELDLGQSVEMSVKFHPKCNGRFVATALLYLDKHMTVPYSNLTFYGKKESRAMTPSTYRIILPPCSIETTITRIITIDFEAMSDLDAFSCNSKDESHVLVSFIDHKIAEVNNEVHTIVTVELEICSKTLYTGNVMLNFYHESGASCDVDVRFCVTHCPITLHANHYVELNQNPFPYYPLSSQSTLYDYLEKCCTFLEKWMFQQGFRRDLYPIIPDTLHAISSAVTTQGAPKSGKGINVSYLNFVRRIAGPLMKHLRKVSVQAADETFKSVSEIHDTYKGIIYLLQARSCNLWALQPTFLLSYEQYVIYNEYVTPKCNADIALAKLLLADIDLFNRLNKQSWIDFILQTYKVFIMDSCFFECVCVNNKQRDIVQILVAWFNEQVQAQHYTLTGNNNPVKQITNITTDLTDGVALASAILSNCPFLKQHFSMFCDISEDNQEGDIVNNACLIIEAMNQLRLYFPLSSKDFFEPNFLQMLFLSIHLYVVLPMFKPKATVILNPPLLQSSTRQVSICPSSQESLIFSHMILNNHKNAFAVEKLASADNGKKMSLCVKYVANFVDKEECLLLVHGYNKTRIYDTYVVFILQGQISTLNPERKCKVTGPLYRPNKVDIMIASPFASTANFSISITDIEPSVPVNFDDNHKSRFYVRRLNLIDKEVILNGAPKESGQDIVEHKLYLQIICLSTQVGNSWIWFRSEIGQFFIRVTTQPRWDLAIDTLQGKLHVWPIDPCSCGESCECYRTTVLTIPHRNDLMLKALRYALIEHASAIMMNVYDQLIDTTTGKLILAMLFEEGGTNMSEVNHILRSHNSYRLSSKALVPRVERVTLAQHTNALLTLPVTIPFNDKMEKYTIIFTSDCGMDIRTYRIVFIGSSIGDTSADTDI